MLKKFLFCSLITLFITYSNAQDLSHIKDAKAFRISGGVSTGLNYMDNSNITDAYKPFSYIVNLRLTPSVYGFSFPFSFSYSQMNRSFSQPFYRFGISPTYKWAKLNLGYRNTGFSKYTVYGQKSLGVGVELHPGKFRFAAMVGKFHRNKSFRTINPLPIDQEEYTRKGYAVKLGVGSKINYFDLIFMQIKDDISLFSDTDKYKPEANAIVSANTKFNITKTLRFKLETAVSAMTQNMLASDFEMQDVPSVLLRSKDFLNLNMSSSISFAGNASLDLHLRKFSAGLQYKRIEPGFRSLGTGFIRDDYESYQINMGYHVSKFNIRAGIGLLHDNLRNTKMAQTNRIINNVSLNYNPTKNFGINANYTNFSTQQAEGRLPLNDTIKLYQVNKNISLMPHWQKSGKKYAHYVSANLTYADMVDKNEFTQNNLPVQSNTAMLQYMLTMIPFQMNVGCNASYIKNTSIQGENVFYGPTLSIGKTLLKNKLQMHTAITYFITEMMNNTGKMTGLNLGTAYRLSKTQKIRFQYSFMAQSYEGNANLNNINRSRANLTYQYNF